MCMTLKHEKPFGERSARSSTQYCFFGFLLSWIMIAVITVIMNIFGIWSRQCVCDKNVFLWPIKNRRRLLVSCCFFFFRFSASFRFYFSFSFVALSSDMRANMCVSVCAVLRMLRIITNHSQNCISKYIADRITYVFVLILIIIIYFKSIVCECLWLRRRTHRRTHRRNRIIY